MPRSQMRALPNDSGRGTKWARGSPSGTRSAFVRGSVCATSSRCSRIVLSDGASFADFVKYLNGHVFFWSDYHSAGKRYRENFRAIYPHPLHIGLRCRFAKFARCESGSGDSVFPVQFRLHAAKPKKESPLPEFIPAPLESRGGQRLAEVVVRKEVRLPDNTQIECEDGNWRDFFCGDAA